MSATASESENIALVRRGYEAFANGDIATLKTLFAPNAIWHATATGVLRGNYRGAQAILEFFGQVARETQVTVRVEHQTIGASGDQVFVLQRTTGKRNGKTQDTQAVVLYKIDKGVMIEAAEFQFDHPAVAQFWS
jgi:ketosteroid isomerase-like protein